MGLEMPDTGEITNGDLSYRKLIDHIDEGIIHIPEFQREFVWNEQKILDLLDSIYKSYPIGSLIFWVTSEDFAYSAPIGGNESDSSSIYKSRFFVIDGQQRLKSLYHAAKAQELVMENRTKQIDIVFDLANERFISREDIRNRRRSAYSVPGVRDNQMILNVLKAVSNSALEKSKEKYELSENQLDDFLSSLEGLGLITETEEGLKISKIGMEIVEDHDNERIARILADNVKFMKESIEIIRDQPGISRTEGAALFQPIYGKSENTAYHQFGRRCKWLRALGIVKKQDGGYHLNSSGQRLLSNIEEREKEIQTQYVPLNRILVDQEELDYGYMSKFSKSKQDKINKLRKTFGNYEFSVIMVNKADWEEVCDIFERINTQGQVLTVVDLMIAKTWSGEEFNLREELQEFKKEIGEDIPDITILQALSLNIQQQCRRRDILSLASGEVKDNWEDVIESLRKSIDFLKNNINLPTLNLLPYPAQLVPLSRFFYEMGNEEPTNSQKENLVRWFWRGGFSNRFDSAVETKLEEDGESMEDLIESRPVEFRYSYPQRTVEGIISREYSLRNAFVKTLICLFASKNPLNPINNSPVSHSNFSKYKQSEMHHIFPRNYLRDRGVDSDRINSIANIMFLPANVNKQEGFSDAPSEYLEEIDNPNLEKALRTHLIPDLEESGIEENDYTRFLNYRAKRILNAIEAATGEESIASEAQSLSPETPFTNEMYIRDLIRNCDSYLYWFDKYFTRRGLEFLIQEVDPGDIDEIKILTGTAQTDHELRSDFENFKQELEKQGVGVEMRVLSSQTMYKIHDRWLIAENQAYNIPSINTIGSNQYTEVSEAATRPPFSDWWDEADDILEDWNDVQKAIS